MADECGVPSLLLGACDMQRGHEGDMHASGHDGFYARCGIVSCHRPLQPGDWYTPGVNVDDSVLGYVCGSCVDGTL